MEARTAIVTGASSGLGAEIACALGELGWRVAIGARRDERLRETAERIEAAGGSALAHALDVSSMESIDRFFDAVESRFDCADVVVNNAGLSIPGLLHELEPKDLAYELTVNLIGPTWVCRRALPPLLASGRAGDLVFVSSDAARQPRPQQATYSAAKAGLESLARAVGMELEGSGVRCTVVRPGPAFSEYAATWGAERITGLLEYWKALRAAAPPWHHAERRRRTCGGGRSDQPAWRALRHDRGAARGAGRREALSRAQRASLSDQS